MVTEDLRAQGCWQRQGRAGRWVRRMRARSRLWRYGDGSIVQQRYGPWGSFGYGTKPLYLEEGSFWDSTLKPPVLPLLLSFESRSALLVLMLSMRLGRMISRGEKAGYCFPFFI
ncbi:hypothetical protein ACFX15_018204 [Malus domestica]